ncbi:MAG TPA: hypothetical protein VED01_24495 [Burkholderiales bacterium]|nr:hypothetical protein [Burkholderiales bacterium]
MAAGKRTHVTRILHQTESTNEPLSGAQARRKALTKPAQRKSLTKKPSKALERGLDRTAGVSALSTKGGVARPAVSRKPPGRGKKR